MPHGEGDGTPLQYSCLENPRDGGAWWTAVSGVAQSRTRLKRLSSRSMCSLLLSLSVVADALVPHGLWTTTTVGSSVRGLFQARLLEWVDFSYSRGSSRPRDQSSISCISCMNSKVIKSDFEDDHNMEKVYDAD